MRGSHIKGNLDCDGGSFKNAGGRSLDAEAAKIGGDALFRNEFTAEGEVRLLAARIGGDLDCIEGSFKNAAGRALDAETAKIGGAALLSDGFAAEGEVRLFAAEIGGDLDCSGGCFKAATMALTVDAAKIGRAAVFDKEFTAEGMVSLASTEITVDLRCSGGSFKNAGHGALVANAASIGGSAFLDKGFNVEGEVVLRGAEIEGDLIVGGDVLHGGADLASRAGAQLSLQRAEIKGTLDVSGIRSGPRTVIRLGDSSCNVLVDDPRTSWPEPGKLQLDGFAYRRVANPGAPEVRLEWLRRQFRPGNNGRRGQFRPQPYRQIANVFRAHGLEAEAKAVLIGMARDRRRWSDLDRRSRAWQWVLWVTIRNGHQPLRAFYGLLILWVVGFLAFGWGYQANLMLPTERFAYNDVAAGNPLPGQYDPFCALVYAIDTSLPIINFGQRDRWHPMINPTPPPAAVPLLASAPPPAVMPAKDIHGPLYRVFCDAGFTRHWDPKWKWIDRSTLGSALNLYRWVHLALGWFLATMLVAGISGLVGRE